MAVSSLLHNSLFLFSLRTALLHETVTKNLEPWEDRLKAIKLKPSKDGNILFEIKHMKTLLGAIRKDNARKKERQLINPQFILDFDNHTAVYNQVPFNLSPDATAVTNELENLIEYMEGFDLMASCIRIHTSSHQQ